MSESARNLNHSRRLMRLPDHWANALALNVSGGTDLVRIHLRAAHNSSQPTPDRGLPDFWPRLNPRSTIHIGLQTRLCTTPLRLGSKNRVPSNPVLEASPAGLWADGFGGITHSNSSGRSTCWTSDPSGGKSQPCSSVLTTSRACRSVDSEHIFPSNVTEEERDWTSRLDPIGPM